VIIPGSGSGIIRLRRKIPLLFEEKNSKTPVGFIYLKNWLLNGRAASI